MKDREREEEYQCWQEKTGGGREEKKRGPERGGIDSGRRDGRIGIGKIVQKKKRGGKKNS